ncbi:MAG: type II 3-dehydroquinate dehydratase [Oscillospiraceae bacterium]|nr:type II 3-dehydroquinate dehydratase [Oscillospiraceae bacterium]
MKIFVINGPNLNMLGIREPDIYGSGTYGDLVGMVKSFCWEHGVGVEFFQSNHEGDLVDFIQKAYKNADGIVINPAAYTHTSIAIADALKAVAVPYVEVHISDVSGRESYRQVSYIAENAVKTIAGKGLEGYIEAVKTLIGTEGKLC